MPPEILGSIFRWNIIPGENLPLLANSSKGCSIQLVPRSPLLVRGRIPYSGTLELWEPALDFVPGGLGSPLANKKLHPQLQRLRLENTTVPGDDWSCIAPRGQGISLQRTCTHVMEEMEGLVKELGRCALLATVDKRERGGRIRGRGEQLDVDAERHMFNVARISDIGRLWPANDDEGRITPNPRPDGGRGCELRASKDQHDAWTPIPGTRKYYVLSHSSCCTRDGHSDSLDEYLLRSSIHWKS